jgi:hypothetical protein
MVHRLGSIPGYPLGTAMPLGNAHKQSERQMKMLARILTALAVIGMLFSISTVTANASTVLHRSAWGAVIVKCHNHPRTCVYLTKAIRHDLGIGHRHARMFIGDTTVIYVEYSPNHVKKFVS